MVCVEPMEDPFAGAEVAEVDLPELKRTPIKGSIPCAATNSDGFSDCPHVALRDSDFCAKHHVKKSIKPTKDLDRFREQMMINARHDLLRISPDATRTIGELIVDTEVPANVRLKAATEVLDRVGIRGGTEIDIQAEVTGNPSDDIRRRLAAMATGLIAQQQAATEPEPDIVDGEVIDD